MYKFYAIILMYLFYFPITSMVFQPIAAPDGSRKKICVYNEAGESVTVRATFSYNLKVSYQVLGFFKLQRQRIILHSSKPICIRDNNDAYISAEAFTQHDVAWKPEHASIKSLTVENENDKKEKKVFDRSDIIGQGDEAYSFNRAIIVHKKNGSYVLD